LKLKIEELKKDSNLIFAGINRFSDKFWTLKAQLLEFLEKEGYPNEQLFFN
jgi:hypothetical protein